MAIHEYATFFDQLLQSRTADLGESRGQEAVEARVSFFCCDHKLLRSCRQDSVHPSSQTSVLRRKRSYTKREFHGRAGGLNQRVA